MDLLDRLQMEARNWSRVLILEDDARFALARDLKAQVSRMLRAADATHPEWDLLCAYSLCALQSIMSATIGGDLNIFKLKFLNFQLQNFINLSLVTTEIS